MSKQTLTQQNGSVKWLMVSGTKTDPSFYHIMALDKKELLKYLPSETAVLGDVEGAAVVVVVVVVGMAVLGEAIKTGNWNA